MRNNKSKPFPGAIEVTVIETVVRVDPFDLISAGSTVTILTPHGQERKGRAVMRNRQYGSWVLNMGGRHGTPGIATRENTVKVRAARRSK